MKIYTKESEQIINELKNAIDIIEYLFGKKEKLDNNQMRQTLNLLGLEYSEVGYENYELKDTAITNITTYISDFYKELIEIPEEEYKGVDKTWIIRSILNFKRYFLRECYLQSKKQGHSKKHS